MMTPLMQALLIVFIGGVTLWVFINTIVTRKWRDKAPGEAESWKWGVFYYNPDDDRIMLPKRTGLGFTLNFARPGAIVLFMFALVVILFFSLR